MKEGFNHRSTYTDAPPLHANILLGSLQLLFWLFFHPSAWRHHLARVDANLRPGFCLVQLNRSQWLNWSLWRFLLMSSLLWPLLVAVIVGLSLWLTQTPREGIVLGLLVGVAVGLIANLAASIVGSVAVGVAAGIAVGLVVGIGGALSLGGVSSLAAQTAALPFELIAGSLIGLAGGLAGGLGFAVAAGLSGSAAHLGASYSLTRQMSGVVVGIIIGVGVGLLLGVNSSRLWIGLVVGEMFGLAVAWRTGNGRRGLTSGVILGTTTALSGGLIDFAVPEVVGVLGLAILISALFSLPYVLTERIAGPAAGAVAGALGSGGGLFTLIASLDSLSPLLLFSLLGISLGLTLAYWRPIVGYPFLMAWNTLLYRLDERRLPQGKRPFFPWHSAFWDEFQRLPLSGLDSHLRLVLDHRADEGQRAMTYLTQGRQRWAAQAAQIELDARQLAQCETVAQIGRAHRQLAAGGLSGPASALLRSFSRISRDIEAALQQESAYNRRLALSAVEDRLDGLLRELTRSNEPYAARFSPIAADWRKRVAAQEQQLAQEAELRQEIDSPYIIGVPLTEQQEIFVGRTEISARIEQLLLDRRQPPLLLYGQRRVGKTSLLHNLGRLLPSHVVPLFVDLQGPASRAPDHAGFLYNVARSMGRSAQRQRDLALPSLPRDELGGDPFTCFDEWLDTVEDTLGQQMALLMLDEFEVLATALQNGRFEETTILGWLRHLIQHRPRFKVLLSGSHTLDDFQRWASYLINVQVIHIGYLSYEETRQLVEQPVQEFALRYEPAAGERVWRLTQGHPFLVQLLCAEIVALKNEQEPAVRRLATVADVETAVAPALEHGSFFFADIEQNQVDAVGREVLRLLAQVDEGKVQSRQALVNFFPSLMALEEALADLQRRELIEQQDGGYRFRVEMVRRWFGKRP